MEVIRMDVWVLLKLRLKQISETPTSLNVRDKLMNVYCFSLLSTDIFYESIKNVIEKV